MEDLLTIKKELLQYCKKEIEDKSLHIKKTLKELNEDAQSDTKSSAGDKYETAREMINLEKAKLDERYQSLQSQKKVLHQIKEDKKMLKIDLGTLFKTEDGYFFIAISMGKITFKKKNIFLISLVSPIGKVFYEKKKGESVIFNGRSLTILEIC